MQYTNFQYNCGSGPSGCNKDKPRFFQGGKTGQEEAPSGKPMTNGRQRATYPEGFEYDISHLVHICISNFWVTDEVRLDEVGWYKIVTIVVSRNSIIFLLQKR